MGRADIGPGAGGEALYRLRLTGAGARGRREIAVGRGISVGRSPDNDLVLEDPLVSKEHARVFVQEGHCFVEDLRSRNGTRLNGVPIGAGAPVRLDPGDVLEIGSVEAVVEVGPSAGPSSALAEEGEARAALHLRTLGEFVASLGDTERALLAALAPEARDDLERAAAFVRRRLAAPLRTVREENRALAAGGAGAAAAAVRMLNARAEALLHPEAARREDVSTASYEALDDVEWLMHGDILPSHLSRLEEPTGWDLRELLVVHKADTDLAPLLDAARAAGVARQREIAAGAAWGAALDVLRAFLRGFSPEPEGALHGGEMKSLGYFSRRGGSCRHRAAALQLMLQEAGIRSRYVRGVLLGAGAHAWVEVSADGGDAFERLLDPNFGLAGLRTAPRPMGRLAGEPFFCFGLAEATALAERPPESPAYGRAQGPFNTVWRPKRRAVAGL